MKKVEKEFVECMVKVVEKVACKGAGMVSVGFTYQPNKPEICGKN